MVEKKKTPKRESRSDDPAGEAGRLHRLAAVLGAAAHPVRLLILEHLLGGVKCVKDLNELIPVSQPNLSQHMAALREVGLVDCQSNGPLRCYYIIRRRLVRNLLSSDPRGHPVRRRSRASVLNELHRVPSVPP
jgi:ArsR family transcriptional regulator